MQTEKKAELGIGALVIAGLVLWSVSKKPEEAKKLKIAASLTFRETQTGKEVKASSPAQLIGNVNYTVEARIHNTSIQYGEYVAVDVGWNSVNPLGRALTGTVSVPANSSVTLVAGKFTTPPVTTPMISSFAFNIASPIRNQVAATLNIQPAPIEYRLTPYLAEPAVVSPVPSDNVLADSISGGNFAASLAELDNLSQVGISQSDTPERYDAVIDYAYEKAATEAGATGIVGLDNQLGYVAVSSIEELAAMTGHEVWEYY